MGDFNCHSPRWSPPGFPRSTTSDRIEEWAAGNGLELLTTPGIPTRRGEGSQRDSTIDLTWRNYAASLRNTFQHATPDWEGSVGSDHALIRTIAITERDARPPKESRGKAFDLDVEPEELELWQDTFKAHTPILRAAPQSPAEIDTVLDGLYEALQIASDAALKRKGANTAHSARWWNSDCKAATSRVKQAQDGEEKTCALRDLKATTRRAKRDWADAHIQRSDVWEVAQWRHGRRQSGIPAIRMRGGNLTYEHEEMAEELTNRFFAEEREPIPLTFADDPSPRETREFQTLSPDEVYDLLRKTANKTAPGTSGFGWQILKWAWPTIGETLTFLFDACLTLGHHPERWREAVVVVIPKPDKADYTLPKAYRPIALLECMSKLLEKVVANRIQHDITALDLVPTNQFSGRQHSSCTDAGLSLLHDIQTAHAAGLKCAILLFDVQGFFDHVNHGRLVSLIQQLGFNPKVSGWMSEFLRDRRVRLKFNNILSETRGQPVGVPQGSPISPVLSIIYTSPLLHLMKGWTNSSLGMYVDDGVIFACAKDWGEVTNLLQTRYTVCMEWLRKSGLAIEPDKTELMFFQRPYARNPAPRPSQLALPDPMGNAQYHVKPVEVLRYLGIFFHWRLKWEPHVKIMANRARASLKALQVLGNSVRGLNMANWRLAFNAICLPVLGYACQLWFKEGAKGQKKLVQILQRVQNEGVKMVSGAFRTAPREALLHITRMLPMRHYLEKLTHTSALRLYRLPRGSQLLRRLGPSWYAPRQGDLPLPAPPNMAPLGNKNRRPTALEALAARVPSEGPRVDVTATPPWEVPAWKVRLKLWGAVNPRSSRMAWTQDLHRSLEGLDIAAIHVVAALTNEGREDGKTVGAAAATLVQGSQWGAQPEWSWTYGEMVKQFDVDCFGIAKTAEALTKRFAHQKAPEVLYLFCPSSSALQAVINPKSKSAQQAALLFHFSLTSFTLTHPDSRFILVWTPLDLTLERQMRARALAKEACLQEPPEGLMRIQSAAFQKDRARIKAYEEWAQDWHRDRMERAAGRKDPSFAHSNTLTRPPDGNNHPLWQAATDRKKDERGRKLKFTFSRRTTSTALQVAVDHAFSGSYALRFRPADSPESRMCPCGAALRTPQHITLECYRFTWERAAAGINHYGRLAPFRKIMGPSKKNAMRLLTFIQETGTFTHPENERRRAEPEPD